MHLGTTLRQLPCRLLFPIPDLVVAGDFLLDLLRIGVLAVLFTIKVPEEPPVPELRTLPVEVIMSDTYRRSSDIR